MNSFEVSALSVDKDIIEKGDVNCKRVKSTELSIVESRQLTDTEKTVSERIHQDRLVLLFKVSEKSTQIHGKNRNRWPKLVLPDH